jgi:hypothetical protein
MDLLVVVTFVAAVAGAIKGIANEDTKGIRSLPALPMPDHNAPQLATSAGLFELSKNYCRDSCAAISIPIVPLAFDAGR